MSKTYINKSSGTTRSKKARLGIGGSPVSFDYVEKKEWTVKTIYNDTLDDLLSLQTTSKSMGNTDAGQINDANMIVVSNIGSQTAIIAITVPDWTLGTDAVDAYGSASSVIQWLLKPGASYILPGTRAVCTSTTATNAANGKVEYVYDGGAKNNQDERPLQLHPLLTISAAKPWTNTIQNEDITAIYTDEFGGFNYNLEAAPSGNLTSGIGDGETGIFNHGGLASATTSAHYVPGSISVRFYDNAWVKLGLKSQTTTSDSGLTASGKYRFKLALDGQATPNQVLFTVDKSNTKWGDGVNDNGILSKINKAINDLTWKDKLNNPITPPKFVIRNGDIHVLLSTAKRAGVTANPTGAAWTNGNEAGYTDIYSQGLFPASGSFTLVGPYLKELSNTGQMMFDDGYGNLVIGNKKVGEIDYNTGFMSFSGAPIYSSMEAMATYESALGGTNNTEYLGRTTRNNSLTNVAAASTNHLRPAELKITAYTI